MGGWLISKYLITAAVIVAVSELAKRSDRLGGFIAALHLSHSWRSSGFTWISNRSPKLQTTLGIHSGTLFPLPCFGISTVVAAHRDSGLPSLASICITVISFGLFALAVRPFWHPTSSVNKPNNSFKPKLLRHQTWQVKRHVFARYTIRLNSGVRHCMKNYGDISKPRWIFC